MVATVARFSFNATSRLVPSEALVTLSDALHCASAKTSAVELGVRQGELRVMVQSVLGCLIPLFWCIVSLECSRNAAGMQQEHSHAIHAP